MATESTKPDTAINALRSILPTKSLDELFTFDGGDVSIMITFQGHEVQGSVASQALVLASPVWKKFIYPPWVAIEKTTYRSKSIDFTDDDGCALLILLRLAHLQFSRIPDKVYPETLFALAVLCEKYQCLALVSPWLEKWISKVEADADDDKTGRWLYISWAFGRHDIFDSVARKCVLSFRVHNEVLRTEALEAVADPMPDKIVAEEIMTLQQIATQEIIQLISQAIDLYANSDQVQVCSSNQSSCDALVYGSLLMGLKKIGLLPIMEAFLTDVSLTELLRLLNTITFHPYPMTRTGTNRYTGGGGYVFHDAHPQCATPKFLADVAKLLDNIGSPVLECHTRHMDAARSLSALEVDILMHDTPCIRCCHTHSAMVACPANEKKRSAPDE
ncbi:hypothetical protein VTL71DRAFT_13225 [Oculimacula yallundae]|uniref:BTB domain-containing protein n=1 Tax=Oculimacula yallundae TaxID=86028 RepID=A0ABR4CKB5_9HELO